MGMFGVYSGIATAADLAGSGQALAVPCAATTTTAVQVTGTWVGTLQFEATVGGINWFSVNATPLPSGAAVTSTTANGAWQVNIGGLSQLRVRVSAYTSGTATVTIGLT